MTAVKEPRAKYARNLILARREERHVDYVKSVDNLRYSGLTSEDLSDKVKCIVRYEMYWMVQ